MSDTGIMLLSEVVATSAALAGTRSRLKKAEFIAGLLSKATESSSAQPAVTQSVVTEIVVTYLSGELRQRRTGVGWRTLQDAPEPAAEASLTVVAVDAAFAELAEMSGTGVQARRRAAVDALFGRATADEQWFLRQLVSGELRQGALDGVMADAVARATGIPLGKIRAATMLRGAAAPVAVAVLTEGESGLAQFGLEVGRGVQPMLAQSATTVAEALAKTGTPAALEWKLDGIRIQAHRNGDHVVVYTRTLDDITARVPEVVTAVRALDARQIVLDGELIALRPDGRPEPFQVTGSRTATRSATGPDTVPLTPYFFDILHQDGQDLLGLDSTARHEWLAKLVPEERRVPRLVTDDAAAGQEFFADAVRRGHEGVMVKSLTVPYEAGRRGSGWVKVKQTHTLDLLVLAAEWGHGRRTGWLSNLHLGARDEETGEFVMLGKTFKGLTDELLRWQTERFQEIAARRDDWVVYVRPEIVVEIAFDGVQTSPRYPAGMALRFARVLRYREDKSPADVDTIQTVRSIHLGPD
ncbi:ATP-dependent DNA ligase [Kribbella solani]|uniref:ATP-dependent DNA ligase n=1 Tax=Kribbella solani TaxID=236067 RepID=UPI0029B7605C|nr:ATP-dependent DNA ligase [Kribbella solani]MDX2971564.1 ATP-dependent DNA ligase [Kribbella solani]MDX3005175.1 ATP-dependent DNA ligase [Kribbella solani]